ncbi:MAG: hypothetical protein N3B16_11785 [Candidatus Aminicenantes bacterium]|nr:hypothetical protein [Candidatus Aminicenantes bacterium]
MASTYELSLYWSTGFNFASFSLVNRSLSSWVEKWRQEAQLQKWQVEDFPLASLKYGYEMEAGLQLALNARLTLAICTGFLYFELNEKRTSITIKKENSLFIYAHPVKATAQPMGINLIYFFPITNNLRFFLKGGGGLLFARYIDREANRQVKDQRFVYPGYQNAKASSKYFLSGFGLAFNPEMASTFFIEANYRLAKVTGFEGVNKAGQQGPLEYYEDYLPSLDFWQARLVIITTKPDPEFSRNRQKSVIDFSGFSVKIGLSVKF